MSHSTEIRLEKPFTKGEAAGAAWPEGSSGPGGRASIYFVPLEACRLVDYGRFSKQHG
jgi:hypothetical protein